MAAERRTHPIGQRREILSSYFRLPHGKVGKIANGRPFQCEQLWVTAFPAIPEVHHAA